MKLKLTLALLLVLLVLGGLAGVKTLQIQKLIAAGKIVCPAAGIGLLRRRARGEMAGHPHAPSAPSPPSRA